MRLPREGVAVLTKAKSDSGKTRPRPEPEYGGFCLDCGLRALTVPDPPDVGICMSCTMHQKYKKVLEDYDGSPQ